MPSTIFMTKFIAFFRADFCREDTDHIHAGVIMKPKPGATKESLEQNLVLVLTAASVGTPEVDTKRLELLWSALHAWLKRSLFMHECCSRLSLCTKTEGFRWGWHLLSPPIPCGDWRSSQLLLSSRPVPACTPEPLTLIAWGGHTDLSPFFLKHQARSSGEVVTSSATASD